MVADVQFWLMVLNTFDGQVPLEARNPHPASLASDACGRGDLAGIGGWFFAQGEPSDPMQVHWFSEQFHVDELKWILGQGPLQLAISALELLAALVLVKCFGAQSSGSDIQLRLTLHTDSMVALGARHRWYRGTESLNDILEDLALTVLCLRKEWKMENHSFKLSLSA